MKFINRLICIMFVLALMPITEVFAKYDAGITDTDFKRHLDFITRLDVYNDFDFTDSNRLVTRGEFASLAVRILNPAKLTGTYDQFKDVPQTHEYYDGIYTAYSYGLLRGTSESMFNPDRAVKYREAIKMLIAALGYEDYSYAMGGYPIGYMFMADSIDLNDGITVNDNADLTLNEVIRLISNALRCNISVINSITSDGIEMAKANGKSCLTEYFDLKYVSGVMSTAGYASVKNNYVATKPAVEIGTLSLECNINDIEEYLGYDVEGWYNDEKDMFITFLSTTSNQTLTIDADDVYDYRNFKIYTYDGNSSKSYTLDRGYNFVMNGRLINPVKDDFLFKEGRIKLINNDRDSDWDIVLAERINYYVVKNINTTDNLVYDINISDGGTVMKNEQNYHYTLTKDGENMDFSLLSANTVLELKRSRDGYLVSADASDKTVKGTVKFITDEIIKIDDTEYRINSYFKSYCTTKVNQIGVFHLAPDGSVTYVSDFNINGIKYGYYLGMVGNGGNSLHRNKFKILLEDNCIMSFELEDKLNMDSINMNCDDARISLKFMQGQTPIYQLIRFRVNSNDRINLIDTFIDAPDLSHLSGDDLNNALDSKYSGINYDTDSLTRYLASGYGFWRGEASSFIPFFSGTNIKCVSVPTSLRTTSGIRYEDGAFKFINMSELTNDGYYVDAFDYDETMTPAAAVVYNNQSGGVMRQFITPSQNAPAHIIEEIYECLDDDGEVSRRFYTYSNGEYKSYVLDHNLLDLYLSLSDSDIPKPGDIVRFAFVGNYICGIAIDVKLSNDKKSSTIDYVISSGENRTKPDGRVYATLTYVSGKVYSVRDNKITLKTENYPVHSEFYTAPLDGISSIMSTDSTMVAIYNTINDKIEHGYITDLTDIRSAGENDASYVVIKMSGYEPQLIVIYK